jgi:hypothetical protein
MHVRPPEVDDRVLPGHWEGDFLKGAGNRSAVGVRVERSSRLVLLAKRDDATATSALAGYIRKLNSIAAPMRQTLTYGQGQEMARHAELTSRPGSRSPAATRIALGNAGPARTPTASCASTSPRGRTCPSTARKNAMRSRNASTSGHARSTATSRQSVSIGLCWVTTQVPSPALGLRLREARLGWSALEGQGERVEEMRALLVQGRQIGAKGAEGVEAARGAQATGDLLFDLGHA